MGAALRLALALGITVGTAFWSIREMEARAHPDQSQHGKRPDVLVFRASNLSDIEYYEIENLLLLDDTAAEPLAKKASLAIECEFITSIVSQIMAKNFPSQSRMRT